MADLDVAVLNPSKSTSCPNHATDWTRQISVDQKKGTKKGERKGRKEPISFKIPALKEQGPDKGGDRAIGTGPASSESYLGGCRP